MSLKTKRGFQQVTIRNDEISLSGKNPGKYVTGKFFHYTNSNHIIIIDYYHYCYSACILTFVKAHITQSVAHDTTDKTFSSYHKTSLFITSTFILTYTYIHAHTYKWTPNIYKAGSHRPPALYPITRAMLCCKSALCTDITVPRRWCKDTNLAKPK